MEQKEQLTIILQAVAKAFGVFSSQFRWGKTSGALLEPFMRSLRDSLGVFSIQYDYIWGADTCGIDGVTQADYIPQEGDAVIMDISVGKNGVWCDVCRTFFAGSFSPEQAQMYHMIRDSIRAGEQKLQAGVQVGAIYDAVNAVYENSGKTLIHHAGHRIGEGPLEPPFFVAKGEQLLENGCFYTIESGCYDAFGIRLENDYQITSSGAENLFENLMSLEIKEYVLHE